MNKTTAITLPELNRQIALTPEWLAERDNLVTVARGIEAVTDPTSFDAAAAVLSRITTASNALEKFRKQITDPFLAAQRQIKEMADNAREALESEKERLKRISGAYIEEQRKKQAEEARRNEEEQRKQIERQAAEHEAKRELGIVDDASEFKPEVTALATTVQVPTSGAVKAVERVVFELLDEERVLRNFLSFDERKANEFIRQHGDNLKERIRAGEGDNIAAGLRFKIKTDVQSRGRY